MPHWKRNLIVLCLSQFLTLAGFSAYLTFTPFYMQELGAASIKEATSWQAVFETGGAIAMMLSAPLWGSLSDRYGRKMMVVRATAAGAVSALLMGLVQSPSQLVMVRILQGALCGTVSASMTLIATETPEENLVLALGLMQTTQYAAFATGPLLGGIAADTFGYRAVFPISSGMMAVALGSVAFLVRERFRPLERKPSLRRLSPRRRGLLRLLTRDTAVLLMALASTRFAYAVLTPVLSLYIKALSPGHTRIATLAGTIMSVSAVTSSVAALVVGRLGDRVGLKRVLVVCSLGVALAHVPQAFVSNSNQLLLLRGVQGLFVGGMMPTATALLARSTPSSRRGTVFGLASGVQSGGRAMGPMIGAGVANAWGMSRVFLVTAGVYAMISVMVGTLVRAEPARFASSAEEAPVSPASRAEAPTSSCS